MAERFLRSRLPHKGALHGSLFFDLRSSDAFSHDEEGVQLPDTEAAHEEALNGLLTAAREAVLEGAMNQHFAVEVRDGTGPVLEVAASFHSKIFRTQ